MPTHHSQNIQSKMSLEVLRAGLDHLTVGELQLLKRELDYRLEETDDWLDTEYIEYARKHGDSSISLESVREALAKIQDCMSDVIIQEREDRF